MYSVVGSLQLILPRYDDGPCLVLISRHRNWNIPVESWVKDGRRNGRLPVLIR